MSTICANRFLEKELVKLEKQHLYSIKEKSLDFSDEPLFPDWWQISLAGTFGMLFEPCIAAEAAEAMLTCPREDVSLIGHINIHQASVLHPHIIHPDKVVELPLFDLTKAHEQNRHCYAIGRLFVLALSNGKMNPDRKRMEASVLMPYVEDFHIETYEALAVGDIDRLAEMRDSVLASSPHRLFRYWWEIFYETHLYKWQRH